MIIFKKQYQDFFTRKFEFNYTDFQPEASTQKIIPVKFERQGAVLLHCQFKLNQIFSGFQITSATIYLTDDGGLLVGDWNNSSFAKFDGRMNTGSIYGVSKAIGQRFYLVG